MADPTTGTDTVNTVLYYLNQGGPVLQGAIVGGLYKAYQLATNMLSEVRRLNLLIAAQNQLLEKFIDKENPAK